MLCLILSALCSSASLSEQKLTSGLLGSGIARTVSLAEPGRGAGQGSSLGTLMAGVRREQYLVKEAEAEQRPPPGVTGEGAISPALRHWRCGGDPPGVEREQPGWHRGVGMSLTRFMATWGLAQVIYDTIQG